MERLNLNIPADTKRRLRAIARNSKKTESELARELLVAAVEKAEAEAFFEKVAESQTPAVRQRELEILAALETLHG